ncbi:MAG: hypothetical protein M3Q05_10575, partial [Bacteroidota bacterium]|nr:hypothetical protein [Bacteroidota bacterium]
EQETEKFENITQEQVVKEPGAPLQPLEDATEVPVPPKTPRPRPIFKRPTPGANTESPSNKPATE